ncbi:DUF1476 domain-containing protein [Falsirhodobacter sp. 20TX0035]|uniref:DUF1476 domain-containing protein n=1 Tax=Falsirhodobacter sp. 20TX0035 TaxID=3022019 RepID=UPI00232B383A|nr:DUF1476 domain-containing protein [Falsirhodobacter sp. 20TX0035]MDB6452149.1 DUF1476 domain-containing protein [Falsirhodobacter sp. 20TX0035]
MADMTDRARALETQFTQDTERRFRLEARRNRLLGQWAAGTLGRTGAEADAYVATVMRADFNEAGPEDVVRLLVADLQGHATETEIRAKLAETEAQAAADLSAQNSVS